MSKKIITIKNLTKEYEFYRKEEGFKGTMKAFIARKKLISRAVDSICLEVQEGELVGFLGPNGAGKTTTLKILSGIIYPTSGTVDVLGFNPTKRNKEYQKQFAIVMGQKNQLIMDLPPRESFILRQQIYKIPEKEFKSSVSELVNLLDVQDILDIPVRKLSLGQRMKCELIASLLHQPKVLYLDEPSIGLDVVAQKNIRDFIKKYNKRNKTTILLTSHYMEDIRQLCDRVVIINLGKIIYDGSLDTLIKKYAESKLLQITFSEKGMEKKLKRFGEIFSVDDYNVTIKIPREKTKKIAAEILSSDLPVEDILISEDSIDDIVRKIFDEKKIKD